jgi:hypothetical protein
MGPMRTPRLSAILSADMERQAPQDPASGSLAAAGSTKAGSMFSPDAVHAGNKRSLSSARFEDRCTEICEAAQGKHGKHPQGSAHEYCLSRTPPWLAQLHPVAQLINQWALCQHVVS